MQRKQERHSVTRRDFLLTSATVGAGVLAFPSLGNPLLAGAAEAGITTGTYTNPVTEGTVDTFPDPVTIRGKDGYWYAYGTTNPIFQSQGAEGENYLPILRSENLVSWEYMGDVFEGASDFPSWFGASARLWAPDIRYINGKYYLYYSVDGGGGGIGLVTAPTPTGPWADSGGSVIRQDPPTGDIDQSEFTDIDGTKYLYWGSYDVMVVAQLNEEGTRTIGEATQVARGRRGEAAFVIRRGDYYYLMYSEAGCCDGKFSGYQVKVGRSKDPRGPFVDRKGTPLTAATTKESFMLSANGNHWIGPGHNAVQTDLAGQDWFIYHAIPEQNPMLDPVEGLDKRLSTRPMLIDRLDWIDGWPIVRAGEWASETPQQAPVTQWAVGSNFNGENALKGWRRHGAAPEGWSIRREDDAAGYVHQETPAAKKSYLVSSDWAPASIRAEADLRQPARSGGASGLVFAYRDENNHLAVWLDARQHALITDILVNGESAGRRETPLPKNFVFDVWHNVAAEIRDRELHVAVSSDRLYDPLALHELTLPAIAARSGAVGVTSVRTRTDATNVGAAALYTPVDEGVPPPRVGALDRAYSDEFDGDGDPAANDPAWSWTRGRAPDAAVTGGWLVWPTQQGDINLTDNTASVLVRDSPRGDFTVETKVELDPTEPAHQAGLVFYDRDDRYVKLVRAALQFSAVSGGEMIDYTDFAKEGARPSVGEEVFYASMYVGTPSTTTCLRVQHRQDSENGQHEFRAATSQDGEDWIWGGVWKLPAEADPRIGLVSMGGTGATARFHYVHTYRP